MPYIFIVMILLCCNTSYAHNEWIPYVPTLPSPPIVEVPSVPSVTYSTTYVVRPPIITYGWVPYYVNKAVVVERNGIFCQHRYITYQPTIEWVYQPVYKQ